MERPKILVPLAHGFEEIEAVTIIDILRRAGAWVTVAGQHEKQITGSHGITISADILLAEATNNLWDWIVIPGGTLGVENLIHDEDLTLILENHRLRQAPVAAICAAPSILEARKFTNGKQVTIHPTVAHSITTGILQDQAVVEEDSIITGRSAGAAMAFSFALVTRIFGENVARDINKGVIAELK